MRGPRTINTAGRTSSDTAPPHNTTSAPPIPIDERKRIGNTSRLIIAVATVRQLNSTVRPTVRSVRSIAS